MKVDESSLTGESIAATKKPGGTVLAGAVVAEGEMDAVVTAIGKECFFGKTMALLDAPQETGHLHQVCVWLCSCLYALHSCSQTSFHAVASLVVLIRLSFESYTLCSLLALFRRATSSATLLLWL